MALGTLALDIDGTITDSRSMLSDEVVSYLETLKKQGWDFIFVTGREFSFSMEALSKLSFDFYLAVQNGADLIVMPKAEKVKSCYLSKKCVLDMQKIYEKRSQDFLVYSGFEAGDFCYFRPHRYTKERLEDVLLFKRLGSLDWVAVEDFSEIPQEKLSMIKCIGYEKEFENIERELLVRNSVNIVTIKNPKSWQSDILLVTDFRASKCQAVKSLMEKFSLSKPLIAAGDDYNDFSNLKLADVAVVMATAPKALLAIADVVAPPSVENGIIKGLNEAIDKLSQS